MRITHPENLQMHRSLTPLVRAHRWRMLVAGVLFSFALLSITASASTVAPNNVVHLLDGAQDIVVGRVSAVDDGIDARGVPYTEVKLAVGETLRGAKTETLVFRQFGLTKPRKMANGRTLYAVRPNGWPEYRAGERVLLFLTPPARHTGLRTTVGLEQGKFTITNNRLQSSSSEGALFDSIVATTGAMSAEDRGLLDSAANDFDANAMITFLRRAVAQRWVETGRLRHAP